MERVLSQAFLSVLPPKCSGLMEGYLFKKEAYLLSFFEPSSSKVTVRQRLLVIAALMYRIKRQHPGLIFCPCELPNNCPPCLRRRPDQSSPFFSNPPFTGLLEIDHWCSRTLFLYDRESVCHPGPLTLPTTNVCREFKHRLLRF